MFIDDSHEISVMYRFQLERDGYEVSSFDNAEEAIVAMAKAKPSLVLMDIKLTGIDGLEGLKRIRERLQGSAPPVLVLTNYSDPEFIEQATQLGALDYMIKSRTTPVQLSKRIGELLGSTAG